MKKTLLTERFQELAGIKPLSGNKLKAKNDIKEDESEFERNTPDRIDQFNKELDALVDEYHAELYLKDDVFTGIEAVKMAALGKNLSEDYSEGNELEVVDTYNKDPQYTVLHLSNGDYVVVNVVDLYQNMKYNQ
jgi:hypothetical protein